MVLHLMKKHKMDEIIAISHVDNPEVDSSQVYIPLEQAMKKLPKDAKIINDEESL